MSVVYLTSAGTSVRRRGEILQVWKGDAKIAEIRLFDLERVVVVGSVQLTTQALGLLLDRGVDVAFLTGRGRLRGTLLAGESRNVYLRLAQFDRWRDEEFRLTFGRHLTRAKLTAQQRLLARFERNHPGELDPEVSERVAECLAQIPKADSLEALRGIEGAGAAIYFGQFGRMLRGVPFPGRKKHPSTDAVNALLSLGYVMLTNEVASALEARGFDPAVGFFHGIRYGRKSLALDMVEPFRQPVIDRLTLRLFNRKQVAVSDFEGGKRGLRLSPQALKDYFRVYEEHLSSPSDGRGTPSWREKIVEQAADLQKMVMAGQAAELYTWRG